MSYLMAGKRAKEMAAVAPKHRFEYLEHEAFGLTQRPLSLFAQSDGHLGEHLLVGRIRGIEVYGFDFPYLAGPRDDISLLPPGFPTVRYENGIQYGCVLVPTEADFPMVHLTRRSRRGLLAPGLETPVQVADKQFKKLFHVWSDDPVFLHQILTPEVVEMLVRTDGRFTFEMYGDAILCLDRTVRPEEFPPLMGLTVTLRTLLPAEIWEQHPLAPQPEAPAAEPRGERTWF